MKISPGGKLRILMSGGAGFVGSHLCDRLILEGRSVVAIDLLTGRRDNLAHLKDHPRFKLLEADVTNLVAFDGEFDYVLHLASPASPIDYLKYPIESMRVGAAGTKNLLDIALAQRVPFLLASTSECYGDPEEHPQKETYWSQVNAVGPRSVYDEAKRFAEALTMAYHRRVAFAQSFAMAGFFVDSPPRAGHLRS